MQIFPSRDSFKIENLWIHGYEVAFLASSLTDLVPMTDPGECFLAGLMHDLGRIVFCSMDQKKFISIAPGDDLLDWERTLFGCTHADAGAWFIRELGLPGELAEITRYHHDPSHAKDQKAMTNVVALAEALAGSYISRKEGDSIWNSDIDEIVKQYSISNEDLKSIGDKLVNAMPDIEKVFSKT